MSYKNSIKSGRITTQGDYASRVNPFSSDEGYYKIDGFYFDEVGSLQKTGGLTREDSSDITPLSGSDDVHITGISNAQTVAITPTNVVCILTTKKKAYFSPYLVTTQLPTAFTDVSNGTGTEAPADRTGSDTDYWDIVQHKGIIYFCNGVDRPTKMRLDDSRWYHMSATTPVVPVLTSPSAGTLNGAYQYVYTYYSSTFDHESAPSPAATISGLTNKTVTIQYTYSADYSIDKIRIYRTIQDGVIPLKLVEIANVPASGGTTNTINDTAADTTLTIAVDTYGNGNVDTTTQQMEMYKNHMFTVPYLSSRVYFSKNGYPNAQHPNDYRGLNENDGALIKGMKQLNDYLVVYKENSIWNGTGDDKNTFAFNRQVAGIGCIARKSVVYVPGQNRHIFFGTGLQFYSYNGVSVDPISNDITFILRQISTSAVPNMSGTIYPDKNLCMWLLRKNNGIGTSAILILYDYLLNMWGIRTLNVNIEANIISAIRQTGFTSALAQTLVEIGANGGTDNKRLFRFDSGTSDYSGNISTEIIERSHPQGADQILAETSKSFYEMIVFFKPQTGTLTISAALDSPTASFTTIGTVDTSDSSGQARLRFNLVGKRLFPRITESSTNSFTYRGCEVKYKDLGRVKSA